MKVSRALTQTVPSDKRSSMYGFRRLWTKSKSSTAIRKDVTTTNATHSTPVTPMKYPNTTANTLSRPPNLMRPRRERDVTRVVNRFAMRLCSVISQ